MNQLECECEVLGKQEAYKVGVWLRTGGPMAILLMAVAMAMATWGKWPDVLIDFGRELYVPWRITEGDTLYRDIVYHNGPLSPHINALWFSLFGVSLRTLIVANLAILALMTALIYSLFLKIGGHMAATLAGVLVILLFAFNQYVFVGNYNYVCPYSHEMTHGLTLSLAAIWCFWRYVDTTKLRWALATGCLTGLTFLTKPEIFLALATAVGLGLVLAAWIQRLTVRRMAALFSVAVSGFLAPVLIAVVLLSNYMPVATSVRSVVGAWPLVLAGQIARLPQYQAGMGLDDSTRSLQLLGLSSAAYIICLALTAGISILMKRWRDGADVATRLVRLIPLALVILAVTPLLGYVLARWWFHAFRPLPLVVGFLGALTLVAFFRSQADGKARKILLLRLTVIVFALVLMLKNLLYSRIHHYGFVLAMPATLLLGTAFVVWLPDWLQRKREWGQAFRISAVNVCIIVVAVFLVVSFKSYARKTHVVGKGADAIRTDWRGSYVNEALAEIARRVGPNDTLAVVPEGVMLNFLTRRANSTPYDNLLPFWFIVYGEHAVAKSFSASAPDWILLVHRDCREFGYRGFGVDFAQELRQWIEQNYEVVRQIGNVPLQSDAFGMILLVRKTRTQDMDCTGNMSEVACRLKDLSGG